MEGKTTSCSPALTGSIFDRIRAKIRSRALLMLLRAGVLVHVVSVMILRGQGLAPDQAVVESASSSRVTGTVRDSGGIPLVGIEVRALDQNHNIQLKVATDSNGAFAFTGLSAGTYQVRIDAPGLWPFASEPFAVAEGVRHELPIVATRMAVTRTTVNVKASLQEVAEAQVKQEETQRLLGLLPNYYTSYIWDAVPMTPKSKFGMAVRTVTDPVSFLVVAGIAATEQYHKTFPGYGQGAEGYARRYGSTYADTVASRMLGSAVFPVLFHQDPRYFYRGSGSVRSRFTYAVMSAVICRADDGRLQPNYSHILGSFAAAGISNLYKAPEDRQAGLTLRNGLIITAVSAAENVMREFLFRRLTPSVPPFQNGKP